MSDYSHDAYIARMAVVEAMGFIAAAHVRMQPRIFPDGTAWCCLYGENLQEGVAGFGDTPAQACAAFDLAWDCERTPQARLSARKGEEA